MLRQSLLPHKIAPLNFLPIHVGCNESELVELIILAELAVIPVTVGVMNG